MQIIFPRDLVSSGDIAAPLFFLAGPILGGGKWRVKCCAEIDRYLQSSVVASPSQWEDKTFPYFRLSGISNHFANGVAWEHHYISLALQLSMAVRGKGRKGCVIFWLPEESRENPRRDGRPYAMRTYVELGKYTTITATVGGKLIIGAEKGFPGLGSLRKDLRIEFGGAEEFPIYDTIEEAVLHAVQFVNTGCSL